jgi:hypothetical protein
MPTKGLGTPCGMTTTPAEPVENPQPADPDVIPSLDPQPGADPAQDPDPAPQPGPTAA